MGTIHVKRARSLPVVFVQHEGDKDDAQRAVVGQRQRESGSEAVARSLLSIMGRHWDSLSALNIDPDAIAGDGGEGIRKWATDTGMPLIRAMVDTAAGYELGDEHKNFKPYYSTMCRGVLYAVSPFHPSEERLLTFGEYKTAVREASGPTETPEMAVLRGIRTFLRSSADGSLAAPSHDACVMAGCRLTDVEREALAQVACAILTDNDIKAARRDLQVDAVRAANADSAVKREVSPVTE